MMMLLYRLLCWSTWSFLSNDAALSVTVARFVALTIEKGRLLRRLDIEKSLCRWFYLLLCQIS
jgi:hypothetical protein